MDVSYKKEHLCTTEDVKEQYENIITKINLQRKPVYVPRSSKEIQSMCLEYMFNYCFPALVKLCIHLTRDKLHVFENMHLLMKLLVQVSLDLSADMNINW